MENVDTKGNELLTVSQTADYLKLSDKTVRRLIKDNELVASKIGSRAWRIRKQEIDNYVQSKSNTKGGIQNG
jgi:DNA (cytosine-5)-methyltransferase 1